MKHSIIKKFISFFMSWGVVIAITLLVSPSVVLAAPVVNAGEDQAIYLPNSSVTLSGFASDPNGIAFYNWTLVDGPNSPNIVSPSNAVTEVNGLVAGVYTFRLTAWSNFTYEAGSDDVGVLVLSCDGCEYGWDVDGSNSGQGGVGECRTVLIDCNFSPDTNTGPTADCLVTDPTNPSSPYNEQTICNAGNIDATVTEVRGTLCAESGGWGDAWDETYYICAIIAVPPAVINPTATNITTTGATLGADVISLGFPASISARGTCWGTSPEPTTNCVAEGGLTTGVFTHSRTGFSAGTTYYYRGYATNSTGTGYSPDATFATTPDLPDLVPADFGWITSPTSATVGTSANFRMEIRNAGTVSTITNFTNRLRKANDWFGGGATNVAINSAGPLAAGGQTSGFSISYTPVATDVGTKYFSICADENLSNVGTINETNENNNCGAWTGVTISEPAASNPTSVTCSVSPIPSALIGETVTWSATPSGGTPPYSYQWMSVVPSHIPTPAPTTQSFSITYSTIGIKNAYVQVTDSVGQVTQCASPGPSIEIKFNPTFEEF